MEKLTRVYVSGGKSNIRKVKKFAELIKEKFKDDIKIVNEPSVFISSKSLSEELNDSDIAIFFMTESKPMISSWTWFELGIITESVKARRTNKYCVDKGRVRAQAWILNAPIGLRGIDGFRSFEEEADVLISIAEEVEENRSRGTRIMYPTFELSQNLSGVVIEDDDGDYA
jgi:hypothetical protein